MVNEHLPDGVVKTPWPIFRSFRDWRMANLSADVLAGLTLAAIAIPEQMATARLGGFAPQFGFLAIVSSAIAFAVFGSNRLMSIGADSTITPIFAGSLALLAASGSPHYAALASLLAMMVGALLVLGGGLKVGAIADLLSIPVTTGFLAGIAGHIVVSQTPALLGVATPPGSTLAKAAALVADIGSTNILTLSIGLGVLAIMLASEWLSPRIPGALIGLGGATLLVGFCNLEAHGVSTLGALAAVSPHFAWPHASWDDIRSVTPLALIVAIVVMVQTAATTRSFVSDTAHGADVNQDFIGVGAANLLASACGTFPVNASPPRTAVVAETGGVSQLGALICAALALALSAFGAGLLTHVPHAALAGVLLFVAQRIFRVSTMRDIWRRNPAEFGFIIVTLLAILLLPIQAGVAIGVMLSLLHGVWSTTRARVVEFERIPGSTVWWPKSELHRGETVPGVRVIALQAPLSFLNAYAFQRAIQSTMTQLPRSRLLVIEANAIVEIDYTAATVLGDVVRRLRKQDMDVAFARLESVRAQESFRRLGLEALVGGDHLFHSVEEAVHALSSQSRLPSGHGDART